MSERVRLITCRSRAFPLAALIVALAVAPGCSLKTMAVKTVANTLSDTGDVFTRDDDPELVRDATPFALKLYESLLESVPDARAAARSRPAAASRSTATRSSRPRPTRSMPTGDEKRAQLRERALKHYLRGRGYCLRAMDARFGKGTSEALLQDPVAAVAKAQSEDVPLLYWTAASWGAAIALGIDRPDLAVDFPIGARAGRSRPGARRRPGTRARSTS